PHVETTPITRSPAVSEQPTPDASAERGIPYQMDVYFPSYPSLDHEALARFVSNCEPGGAECDVSPIEESEGPDGRRAVGCTAFMGDLRIAALVHNVPSPAADLIRHSTLPKAVRDQLAAHGAFALLTQLGGEDLRPVERVLFLYKVAAGLCAQGGVGTANFYTHRVLPGGVLRDLFDKPDGGAAPLFEALRQSGEPIQLLAHVSRVDLEGRRYLATCGFGACGLPELLWAYTDDEEEAQASEMFQNLFRYLLQRGPVIQAGHTVGYDENVAFRFSEAPEGLRSPRFPTVPVLLMSKDTGKRPRR